MFCARCGTSKQIEKKQMKKRQNATAIYDILVVHKKYKHKYIKLLKYRVNLKFILITSHENVSSFVNLQKFIDVVFNIYMRRNRKNVLSKVYPCEIEISVSKRKYEMTIT